MTPTDEVVLRPATAEDTAAMALVQERARAAAPMPEGPGTLRDLAEGLLAGLATDHLWVAEVEGEVCGYVRFVSPDAQRVGWLDDLYLDPAWAGRGIGTLLLDLTKAHLGDGFGLWMFRRNLPAREFYLSRGLREVEHVHATDSPTGEAELRLEWSG